LLAHAYARRKQFEARLIAVEVGKLLAGAPASASASTGNRFVTHSGRAAEQMPARAMLDQMGVKLDF
jgi:hypothetical protein